MLEFDGGVARGTDAQQLGTGDEGVDRTGTNQEQANEEQGGWSEEQKEYLAGFATGAGLVGPSNSIPQHSTAMQSTGTQGTAAAPDGPTQSTFPGPDRYLFDAQDRADNGGTLVAEERAKRTRHPLDRWDELVSRSRQGVFPAGVDVFLTKSFGMFYVAPAQNSFMCRLRLPGGVLSSHQLLGLADLADDLAGGYCHVTTRANLQLREIAANSPPQVLSRLADLGIVTRGSGADNIRNVTATPTAGFDRQELIDVLPFAREMHDYILNHREMYHLPRKFNISFDGGGVVSTLADTNDIGFQAVRIAQQHASDQVPAGVYFRVQLGGISGHRQLASDVGWLIEPGQTIETAAAIVRVFIAHGDRTDRKKARLKYLVDAWGTEKFLKAVRSELPFTPHEIPLQQCELPRQPVAASHLGFHEQADAEKRYVGVVVPVGYLSSQNMRDVARIASKYGAGTIRLTCWQNLLIPHIDASQIEAVQAELRSAGLDWQAHSVRAGLVACTGNAGCKFAASDTKRHALQIAEHVEKVVELDRPVNIHLTGCHHSCAQHYIGDIGLIAAKVEVPVHSISGPVSAASSAQVAPESTDDDTEEVEGYHVFIGGGFGVQQGIGRELLHAVPAADLPHAVERILKGYMEQRDADESFIDFARRHDIDQLRYCFDLDSFRLDSAPSV